MKVKSSCTHICCKNNGTLNSGGNISNNSDKGDYGDLEAYNSFAEELSIANIRRIQSF